MITNRHGKLIHKEDVFTLQHVGTLGNAGITNYWHVLLVHNSA